MKVEITVNNTVATVSVAGNITSANAMEFENATADLPGDNIGVEVDASELEFISSAGLRVLLSIKKRCKDKSFKIINVNDDIMKIFDITGFSEIMDVSRPLRKISVDGCEKIGAGACGECFRLDEETIIKLYYAAVNTREIENEKDLAKKAFVLGVPTAISYDIVEADGRIGVVYELINSKTLAELIRNDEANIDKYIDKYVDICKTVHKADGAGKDLPSFRDVNRADIAKIIYANEQEKELLYKFIDMIPDRTTCLHGDLNLNNIMVQNGECCLIDMAEFSVGNAMFDISRIVFSMKYAAPAEDEFNTFYKLPQKTISYIYHEFMKKYFGCDTIEEAEKINPDVKWLFPLAWFRCATAMLKNDNWLEGKREMAAKLLKENLIPFIKNELNK